MESYRDYLLDCGEIFSDLRGIECKQYIKLGIEIKDVFLSKKASERVGRASGRYISIADNGNENFVEVAANCMRELIGNTVKDPKHILCCGIGNAKMTTDSLGALTTNKIKANVMKLNPSVEGLTNIPSIRVLSAVADRVKADLVIIIDALSARSYKRIGTSYQMTDSGINIGGGVGRGREINEDTLKIPIIAIGVPTVISAYSLISEYVGADAKYVPRELIITPKDIDAVVERSSSRLAEIIDSAVSA